MINEAIKKLTEECEKKGFDPAYVAIEEILTKLCTNDRIASQILKKDKTIGGCFKQLEDYARAHKNGSCGCVPPSVAEDIIIKYYDIVGAQPSNDPEHKPASASGLLDIADFL